MKTFGYALVAMASVTGCFAPTETDSAPLASQEYAPGGGSVAADAEKVSGGEDLIWPCHIWGCDDGNPCTVDSCDGGCVWFALADGTSCGDGMVCHDYHNGEAPACIPSCDDGNSCTVDTDDPGGCTHEPLPGGTPCAEPGCVGHCYPPHIGQDGTIDQPGVCDCLGAAHGGSGKAETDTLSICLFNGSPCLSGLDTGVCAGGSCCTGCIDRFGLCHTGLAAGACGGGGAACADCDDGNECTGDLCLDFNAPGYPQCGHDWYYNTTSCADGLGRCDGLGGCCTGCFDLSLDGACVKQCPGGTTCDPQYRVCASMVQADGGAL